MANTDDRTATIMTATMLGVMIIDAVRVVVDLASAVPAEAAWDSKAGVASDLVSKDSVPEVQCIVVPGSKGLVEVGDSEVMLSAVRAEVDLVDVDLVVTGRRMPVEMCTVHTWGRVVRGVRV